MAYIDDAYMEWQNRERERLFAAIDRRGHKKPPPPKSRKDIKTTITITQIVNPPR